jgi:hypothetical protein
MIKDPALSEICERMYSEKAREYVKDIGGELQAIILMNESKTYEQWASENEEALKNESNGRMKIRENEDAARFQINACVNAVVVLNNAIARLLNPNFLENELERVIQDVGKFSRMDDELRDLRKLLRDAGDLAESLIDKAKSCIHDVRDKYKGLSEGDSSQETLILYEDVKTLASSVKHSIKLGQMNEIVNLATKLQNEDKTIAKSLDCLYDDLAGVKESCAKLMDAAHEKLTGKPDQTKKAPLSESYNLTDVIKKAIEAK